MRHRSTATAAFLLVLAGCDPDRGPLTPDEPRLTKQASTTLQANGTDTLDDTDAFKAALALANVVNVPAGTYYIKDQITLESNNHLVGAGETTTRIIQTQPGYNFFYAAHASNVRVEGLRFEVPAGAPIVNFQVGLRADNSSGVYFYNNRSIGVGLIRIHNVGTPSKPASMSDRSSIIRIEGNAGVGPGVDTLTHGIAVAFADDVKIAGNYLDYYNHAIAVWGGMANPRDTAYTATRYATNVTIASNSVHQVETGIAVWNTEAGFIHYNRVENCTDVCLDAEGSKDVTFYQNTGIDAGNGVLATFFRADNVVFDDNTVRQHGHYKQNNAGEWKLWNTMFGQTNGVDSIGNPNLHRITLKNNRFYYPGTASVQASGTLGVVEKQATDYFEFTGNYSEDTRLSLAPLFSGHVLVSGNHLKFSRATGSSGLNAIYAGNSRGDTGGIFSLTIKKNVIESTVAQSAPAIWAPQHGDGTITSTICGNSAPAFAPLLHVNSGPSHVFQLGSAELASHSNPAGATIHVVQTC